MSSQLELVNGVPVVGGQQEEKQQIHQPEQHRTRPRASDNSYVNTISHTTLAPPLDYSFQDIKSMSELTQHEPAGGRKVPGSPSKSSTSPTAAATASSPSNGASAGAKSVQVQSTPTGSEVSGRKKDKVVTTGIRLSYNELTSLKGFAEAIEAVLGPDHRTNLTWLDLSHCKLTTIDEVLLTYPNLTNLYLHGNLISHISEVKKLHVLTNLQKLTLHGNPLYQARENHGLRNPRSAVIYHLRNCVLKSLDDVVITDVDRRNSLRWAETQPKKQKQRPKDEETEERR